MADELLKIAFKSFNSNSTNYFDLYLTKMLSALED